jgi:hypothetical protein
MIGKLGACVCGVGCASAGALWRSTTPLLQPRRLRWPCGPTSHMNYPLLPSHACSILMVLTDKGSRVEVKCSDPLDMQSLRSGMRIQATGSWLPRIGGRRVFRAASLQGSGGSSLLPIVEGGRAVVGIWVGDLTGFWHACWRLGWAYAIRAQI